MFGLCMIGGRRATRPTDNTIVIWTRRVVTVMASVCAAASLLGVAYLRAQSFPRESQFPARRTDGVSRADVIDDLRERLYQQSERTTELSGRLSLAENRIRQIGRQIDKMKPDVVLKRLDDNDEKYKDDRSERLWLRGALVTVFTSVIVVLFSAWFNKRYGGVVAK